jgi:DNA-binding GntR family transcriptional regulator
VHGAVTRKVELTSLYEDLAAANRAPTTRLLLHELVKADAAMAERLGVDEGSTLLHVRRLRAADGVPLAVLENYLPEQFADITEDELTQWGLYTLLRGRGVTIRIARQRIGARNATTEELDLLELDRRHGAVLTMERVAFDNGAKAVEMGRHVYRPDLYSFEVTLVDK